MTLRAFLSRIRYDQAGSAAEFALVLPLALLFLLGIVDAGRFLYEVNRGEKATQTGTRWAVVTDPVAEELTTADYVGESVDGVTLTQGDRIPAGALGLITCSSEGCECTTAPCPADPPTKDDDAFNRILGRMQQIKGDISADNLIVEYRGSGLGYAGDPNGMEIAPLTTVRLIDISFSPIAGVLFGGGIDLPSFAYTLTTEDANGTGSN